jgi:hypothetical protein
MANDNGWGDGVLNNTIGWGKGADNNTIGWGSVYGDSEAGLTALESAGGGTIPVISGVPTISAESQVGETITATAASATGDPTPTTSWTWQRSADGSTGWANIIGATSITYTLVVADDANYVRAVQTETNASGSDSANSLASAQITPAVSYLLDTYGGASAAYSVRKLSSTTTNSMRVRRSSDNSEQDIGFVGSDLDTASLLSFVGVGDGFVTIWYDQSGNSLNFNQTSAASQAKIAVSGVMNTLGSKPSLLFAAFAGSYTTTANFNHSAEVTAFASWQTANVNQGVFQIGAVNTRGSMFRQGSVSYNARSISSGSDARFITGITTHIIQSGYISNGRQEVYVDNVIGGTIGASTLNSAVNVVVSLASLTGSTFGLNGNMQELIMYSSDQRASLSAINTNMIDNLK